MVPCGGRQMQRSLQIPACPHSSCLLNQQRPSPSQLDIRQGSSAEAIASFTLLPSTKPRPAARHAWFLASSAKSVSPPHVPQGFSGLLSSFSFSFSSPFWASAPPSFPPAAQGLTPLGNPASHTSHSVAPPRWKADGYADCRGYHFLASPSSAINQRASRNSGLQFCLFACLTIYECNRSTFYAVSSFIYSANVCKFHPHCCEKLSLIHFLCRENFFVWIA